MVNFRYFLTTLIAVFLALALGVVLGAGPLQKAIDRGPAVALGGQDLSAELEAASQGEREASAFIDDVANQVLPDTLDELTVALVLLPDTLPSDVASVRSALELSGAQVPAAVELTHGWLSEDQAAYRQTLSAAVSAHLAERPETAGPLGILAQGLVQTLTSPDAGSDLISEMLTDKTSALVMADTLPGEAVDALILIGPASIQADDTQSGSSENGAVENEQQALAVALATASTTTPKPSAAVGQAETSEEFIAHVRTAGIRIITVDQAGTAMASLNLPLALADGTPQAYGQQIGAAIPVAPIH